MADGWMAPIRWTFFGSDRIGWMHVIGWLCPWMDGPWWLVWYIGAAMVYHQVVEEDSDDEDDFLLRMADLERAR